MWVLLLMAMCLAARAAAPDQVLVLYNADWTEDLPGTEPGQDSREVALYYQRRHADPRTGRRPWVLGLRCVHGRRHLNAPLLAEDSDDNRAGIVPLTGGEFDLEFLPDSRFVRLRLPDRPVRVRLEGEGGRVVEVVRGRRALVPGAVLEGGVLSLNARRLLRGTVRVVAEAVDGSWRAERTFYDVARFRPSGAGPDGVRDDRNYLEDVQQQVRAFLEDPRHALPDGTLLRDHVLYLVVCYGLPRVVEAWCGISRGITGSRANWGDLASLEERLATVYYHPGPPFLVSLPVEARGPFELRLIRTNLVRPLIGPRANPYLHPWALRPKPKGRRWRPPPRLTPALRRRFGRRALYAVTRLDGPHPLLAKDQVDLACYASAHLTPAMGRPGEPDRPRPAFLRAFRHAEWGRGGHGSGYRRIVFNLLRPGPPFFNREPVFLPGGIAHYVGSHNGWRRGTPFYRMLVRGATFTGGVARVYHGAPHTTSASWWDDEVLLRMLLGGYDLGEALLASRAFVGWITSLVGDPLLNVGGAVPDRDPPRPLGRPRVELAHGGRFDCARLSVRLVPPEVAQMRVTWWRAGEEPRTAASQRFSGRPAVWIAGLRPGCRYRYAVELVDPYGNRFDGRRRWGVLELRVPGRPARRRAVALSGPGSCPLNPDQGEMILEFALRGERGVELARARSLRVRRGRVPPRLRLEVGGGCAVSRMRFEPGRTYRVLLRWMRWPTVREIWLWEGGRWRIVGSDDLTPWRGAGWRRDRVEFARSGVRWRRIEVFDRADPVAWTLNALFPEER